MTSSGDEAWAERLSEVRDYMKHAESVKPQTNQNRAKFVPKDGLKLGRCTINQVTQRTGNCDQSMQIITTSDWSKRMQEARDYMGVHKKA